MPNNLSGQRAVVTGAASGIGRAVAISLADGGAAVVLHTRSNESGLAETQREIEASGAAATRRLADLSDPLACEAFVDAVWAEGPIDIWVHCAGADVLTGAAAELAFSAKLDLLWRVDVQGAIACTRAVGRRMQPRGGVILTAGWDQAAVGMEGDSGEMFAATKGAVMAFTRSLAKSLAPRVRVNCLAPGWIKTKWGADAPEYWRRRAVGEALVGRWGEPRDVAAAAAFLASPDAAFITGQIIDINGGYAGRVDPRDAE